MPVWSGPVSKPVTRVQEGQQFARDQQRVFVCFASAEFHIAGRRVFGDASLAGIRHSDNHQRFHFTGGDGVVGALGNAPGLSGNEGR